MKVRGVVAALWLAMGTLAVGGCDEEEAPRPIDVGRADASGGDVEESLCKRAADHVMGLCGAGACRTGTTGPACRDELIKACEMDLTHADGVFKYMCRHNAMDCAEAQACTI